MLGSSESDSLDDDLRRLFLCLDRSEDVGADEVWSITACDVKQCKVLLLTLYCCGAAWKLEYVCGNCCPVSLMSLEYKYGD